MALDEEQQLLLSLRLSFAADDVPSEASLRAMYAGIQELKLRSKTALLVFCDRQSALGASEIPAPWKRTLLVKKQPGEASEVVPTNSEPVRLNSQDSRAARLAETVERLERLESRQNERLCALHARALAAEPVAAPAAAPEPAIEASSATDTAFNAPTAASEPAGVTATSQVQPNMQWAVAVAGIVAVLGTVALVARRRRS